MGYEGTKRFRVHVRDEERVWSFSFSQDTFLLSCLLFILVSLIGGLAYSFVFLNLL